MRQEEQQVTQDHPEAVRSTPVPVPPPDGHADAERAEVPEDALDDRGTFDDPAVGDERDAEPDATQAYDTGAPDATQAHDTGAPDATRAYDADEPDDAADRVEDDGRPAFHEPAPLPTAFGAATVGDAVAASALAGGRPEDERDARGEDTAVPGDGAPGRTEPLDDERADPTAGDRLHGRDQWDAEHADADRDDTVVDATDRDDTVVDATDRYDAAVDATDRYDAAVDGTDRDDAVAAGAVGYGSPEPGLVDPDAEPVADTTGRHHDTVDPETATAAASTAGDDAAAGTAGGGTAAGGAAAGTLAGAERPTSGAVPGDAATLFAPEAAQGFRDRWRDVQLRFVDDPQAAVGEAESLVEEAIEALSTALREQRTRLGAWQESGSSDTEQLRVAVRGYRDFLDRVLGR
ncbi:hypothetical protein [Micromonospora sp. WMMD998]|uniref:hypothetical protein n=1 Tax=Micromonospora sp. WMMD998 TaxID=3016092 RepID=UPI00249A31AC|nr:hypothetical protein [Micromonospora sp. WMMD998]WFE42038.1 hypothetical protein O7619_27750 [Micromonospora sp. WMMD998]